MWRLDGYDPVWQHQFLIVEHSDEDAVLWMALHTHDSPPSRTPDGRKIEAVSLRLIITRPDGSSYRFDPVKQRPVLEALALLVKLAELRKADVITEWELSRIRPRVQRRLQEAKEGELWVKPSNA